jgi:PAS domain S-box-containing protein
LRQIASASAAPIYGTTDAQLGNGIIGGSVASFETLGTEGAKAGLRLLSGETIQNVPPRTIPGRPMFDWRQLQRWHVSEAGLPAGSIVQFKQLTAWELYKWYAIAGMFAIILQTMLIVWLMILRMRRRQTESENVRLSSDLREIVSNVPGIVWETRADPATRQRRTTFISSYVQKMLGYSPQEWVEKAPGFGLRLVLDEDRERAARDSEDVMLSGKDGVSEFRWLAKDGSVRWIENHLSPIFNGGSQVIGMRGVALDITNRKLAEEKARQAEEKDRALLAAIPDLMFLQTDDGIYLDYHAKEPSDLFVPPEEFLGRNMREVMPSHLAEQFLSSFQAAEDGGDPVICEYSLDLGEVEKWFEARMVRSGDKILSIVRDITDLKRTEREARELSSRLISAQEDERRRLARELHDGASQNLALLSIEIGTIGKKQPVDQASLDTKMNDISERISRLSDDLHRMSHELHPAVLRHLGLVSAVREFCHEIESANDVKVEFADHDVPRTLPDQISLNLYRIVQESLRNVVKHSGAANVSVLLEAEGKRLRLAISDDGHGFDTNATVLTSSLGLTSMRERARMLNGAISIDSKVGAGTRVQATILI